MERSNEGRCIDSRAAVIVRPAALAGCRLRARRTAFEGAGMAVGVIDGDQQVRICRDGQDIELAACDAVSPDTPHVALGLLRRARASWLARARSAATMDDARPCVARQTSCTAARPERQQCFTRQALRSRLTLTYRHHRLPLVRRDHALVPVDERLDVALYLIRQWDREREFGSVIMCIDPVGRPSHSLGTLLDLLLCDEMKML